MKSAFLIAATSSGCGKTTLSLGLMRALSRRGLCVQPFKCGPDYIDTQFQTIATGQESINLDLFMSSKGHVRSLFHNYSANADISITEGVMGMFDGFDGMSGSSADIARLLDIPVILLINAASTAYSVAATIYGFSRFHPEVRVAGVVFNRVASENHFSYLRKACSDVGIECLGYLKRNELLQVPSRHLGLTLSSRESMNSFIDSAADEVERTIDIDKILSATIISSRSKYIPSVSSTINMTVAVARDEAFNFIYPANLKAFARTIYFSPIHDKELPDADIIYLPGGYPELFVRELEANSAMRHMIKAHADCGKKILGECGGFIYLCRHLDGHKMCGVFPMEATMADSSLSLGYRTVNFNGFTVKGHEFHYSHITEQSVSGSIATQLNAKGRKVDTPVYRYKNTIAGYTHLYWAETDISQLWEK